VFPIEHCHLIVKELELGFGERFLFSFGKTSSLFVCSCFRWPVFFCGFVVAVSFRLCGVFVVGKRIRRILESPRRKRSRKRKGKVEREILLFWLRYAIRIRDSPFYFGIVKKVKGWYCWARFNFLGGGGVLEGRGFLLGEIDSRNPSDDLIFFLRKI
jgi:hypothetical protein